MKMASAPYPRSAVIERIEWDFGSMNRAARGSDIWALTWGGDGNLYTSWGDGGGFGGSNYMGRVSMGVGRIEGDPENWRGFNVWGGVKPESREKLFTGKPAGMLSLDGVLYMSISKQDVWTVGKIAKSTDHGRTWSSGDWDFKSPVPQPKFLNFGKNYESARDEFVYAYGEDGSNNNRKAIILMRVPKSQLASAEGYEFFSGLDSSNKPIWTGRVENRKPVFTDPNGVGWGVRAVYNKGIRRYLLTVFHGVADGDGSWGIFDAPEPWGPWTTVAYYTNWINTTPKFCFDFPVKWISTDGKTLWMVFSGTGVYDSFNLVKARLVLRNE
jgi:hypothetical protein